MGVDRVQDACYSILFCAVAAVPAWHQIADRFHTWGSIPLLGDSAPAGFDQLLLLLVLAPKYISSAEVALVLLLETILSPVWTFVGVGETPTPWTIAGGGLLIAVLTLHELATVFATNSVETTTEGKQASAVTSLAASCDLPEATPSATPSVGLV